MPIFAYKWLGIGLALLALVAGSYFKGRQHANEHWEAVRSKEATEAAEETIRRVNAQNDLVAKYEKEKEDAKAANARSVDAVRRLRDAINNLPRSTSLPVASTSTEVGAVLGDCAQEYRNMAQTADELYGKLQLSQSVYQSIRNRKVDRN